MAKTGSNIALPGQFYESKVKQSKSISHQDQVVQMRILFWTSQAIESNVLPVGTALLQYRSSIYHCICLYSNELHKILYAKK